MPATKPDYQMCHIRLYPYDKKCIATIKSRRPVLRDIDAIRDALDFYATALEKESRKNSQKGVDSDT